MRLRNTCRTKSAITNNPVHDPDGNLTEDGALNQDNQDRQYIWEVENRLIAINKVLRRDSNSTITATSALVTYGYDSRSRRINRTDEVASTTTWCISTMAGTSLPNMKAPPPSSPAPTPGATT